MSRIIYFTVCKPKLLYILFVPSYIITYIISKAKSMHILKSAFIKIKLKENFERKEFITKTGFT